MKPMIKTTEWWQYQASQYDGGKCLKCGSLTSGMFIPPNADGECGIVEKCRTCGWEHLMVAGQGKAPLTRYPRPDTLLRPVGAREPKLAGTRSRVVRLIGAPLKRPSEATGRRKT